MGSLAGEAFLGLALSFLDGDDEGTTDLDLETLDSFSLIGEASLAGVNFSGALALLLLDLPRSSSTTGVDFSFLAGTTFLAVVVLPDALMGEALATGVIFFSFLGETDFAFTSTGAAALDDLLGSIAVALGVAFLTEGLAEALADGLADAFLGEGDFFVGLALIGDLLLGEAER